MATKKAPPKTTPAGRSLVDYVLGKKRAECKVCALPGELREQLVVARSRKIRRAEVIEWLRDDHRIILTPRDLDVHYSARHESPA